MSQSGKCEGVLRDAGDLVLGQRECVQMLQRCGKHVRTQLLQAILVEVTRERERGRQEDSVEPTVPCLVYLQHLQALQLPENICFELSDEIAA